MKQRENGFFFAVNDVIVARCSRGQNQEELVIKPSITVHTAATLSLPLFKLLVRCKRKDWTQTCESC